ncbi:hypothetical protein QMT05_19615 [Cronobacter malonaticus]|nr:hypothetical protein [Cronobacter malonaticus]MDI6469913.1 hypothetical protein [Cronobacter malonaticus]MDK1176050.1 hypothetical protein [Cronobacter malonaticus]MDK1689169.1 hypothetical protein [Cronobacter malonaticus]
MGYDAAGNRTEAYRNPVWHNLLLRLDKFKRMNVTSDEYMRWRTRIGNVKFLGDDGIMGIHTLPYSGCMTLQLSLARKGMIAFAEKAKDSESYLNALRKWSSKR